MNPPNVVVNPRARIILGNDNNTVPPLNARFRVRRERFAGRPFSVGVSYAAMPEGDVYLEIAEEIRYQVQRAAQAGGINVERVQGYISIENLADGATHAWDNWVTWQAIDDTVIQTLLETVQQSNSEIDISDVEFVFLFDPASVVAGAAYEETTGKWPNWLRRTAGAPSSPTGVNCAAWSLCHQLYRVAHRYKRDKDRKKGKQISDAKTLMEKCGWGLDVTFSELEKFTNLYPTKAIRVLTGRNVSGSLLPFSVVGRDFVIKKDSAGNIVKGDNLYLYFLPTLNHYYYGCTPGEYVAQARSGNVFCYGCHLGFLATSGHVCEYLEREKYQQKIRACVKCGILHSDPKDCEFIRCGCNVQYQKGTAENYVSHRCLLFQPEKTPEALAWHTGGNDDGKSTALFAFDFECRMVKKMEKRVRKCLIVYDEDGTYSYTQPEAHINTFVTETVDSHQVNLARVENVFTGEKKVFFEKEDVRGYVDPIQQMMEYLEDFNHGNNICVAHNASGYDSKLIMQYINNNYSQKEIGMISNGQKVMQLKIGKRGSKHKLIFRDSLLHLPGSLAGLAKSFCGDEMAKGYFPHKFNLEENYDYDGPLPPKADFDIMFSARNLEAKVGFDDWYDGEAVRLEQTGETWNFKKELDFYCENDVHVLAVIMKKFHDLTMENFGMSPWHYATLPSFAHALSLKNNFQDLVDEHGLDDLEKDYPESYVEKCQELAENEYWCVLRPFEAHFARKALRGGRTEIKQSYVDLSEEDVANGVHMRYWDVCSMYPYHQIHKKYPVGRPQIEIFVSVALRIGSYFQCLWRC